jgi:hypothetical protein
LETNILYKTEGVKNRIYKKLFQATKVNVTDNWRKLHNEQLHNFYSTTNVITEIKSWIRWMRHTREREMQKC